ncbi:Mitochondrial carrier domain [Pseudocohnilembus persalinus]|uniref:Mitochondrial carrier domain n=1 Tax=Pseudocohnilembus persalinus TaxID=266149 RepID=A0A0V0R4E7_PSEPJ|nr:Mitochondrial carrier domain [Pseudocohnilembus persalinus]|eukprot:KRX09351.1 Mitochondrial carrier domain [Pseudocohnilembus persalinus]
MVGVAKNIIQKEGFLALYSGMKPTIFGMTPYASLKFTFFSSLKDFSQMFQVAKQYSVQTNLMCGSLAGCMAVSITYPTDLIRRRMQVSVMNGQSSGGIYQTFKSVVNQDGYKGLYTGLSATYLKIIPSTALVFAINEYLKQVMNVYQLH